MDVVRFLTFSPRNIKNEETNELVVPKQRMEDCSRFQLTITHTYNWNCIPDQSYIGHQR